MMRPVHAPKAYSVTHSESKAILQLLHPARGHAASLPGLQGDVGSSCSCYT
eukprot:CAMPEP_0185542150 /NCGR_PEP_ID=MMETSP1381-20130426/2445_1 /TAXON_ID=298111 /ORGANISM="Pavlova sp., Strain CCMP459" /LENGTH=50 /DNA_ID=CAMNT_0028154121 /DNA_START=69 /DNA_END=218 /DNA_ORIENTATION=-